MDGALIGVALMLGVLHSMEPDHLAAVTSFVAHRPGRREAAGYGLRWAAGHGGIVLLVGSLLLLLPIELGEGVGFWLERLVGVSLLLLGGWVFVTARTLHAHLHRHADGTEHVHLHAHPLSAHPADGPARPEAHRHGHVATAIGALHGLAGTAPAVAMIPLVATDSTVAGTLYLAAFGVGTAGAMVLYAMFAGAVAGRAAKRSVGLSRALARLAGIGTMLVGLWWLAVSPLAGQERGGEGGPGDGVVRTVLFYSPTCPHCQEVMTYGLPPLVERYGEALEIGVIDTTRPEGAGLYGAVVAALEIPQNRQGVPTLVVGSDVLVGAREIPELLPGIVERGLREGGIEWPPIPEIQQAVAAGSAAGVERDLSGHAATSAGTAAERFLMDPVGNAAAVAVLALMGVALVAVFRARLGQVRIPEPPAWAVPTLALIGMAVASYLTFVEVTGAEAVCGPVGDCNAVQQSTYARFLGVPVGVLGVLGYATLSLAWLVAVLGPVGRTTAAWNAVGSLALFATLFSIYLTFLEPFVIGATCAWCLASAIVATLLMLATTGRPAPGLPDRPGSRAARRARKRSR